MKLYDLLELERKLNKIFKYEIKVKDARFCTFNPRDAIIFTHQSNEIYVISYRACDVTGIDYQMRAIVMMISAYFWELEK